MKWSWKQLSLKLSVKWFGKLIIELMVGVSCVALANSIIPLSKSANGLYYKMGGGSDFHLPPVADTSTMTLSAGANLNSGLSCGAFNPALSITNSINNLKNDMDNLEQGIVGAATGSIAQMPMYELSKADPNTYHLLSNALLAAHEQLKLTVKGCEDAKAQIAQGKNPYADWATISLNDRWKHHLGLTSAGSEDINDAKSDIDQHAGDNGVSWVQGTKNDDGANHAGGLNQPPIHVVADTVLAGYNAILDRQNLQDETPAPAESALSHEFPAPSDAVSWITNIVGDETITTCNDASCQQKQGGLAGRGLLPWITNCNSQNKNDCVETLRQNLANLVSGQNIINQDNLNAVSAENLVISPAIVNSIQNMQSTEQTLVINKIATEVATQRLVSKALLAKTLLQTGSQVPVIAANEPAQKVINNAINHLENDVQSLAFEASVRKQMMSNTLSEILNYEADALSNTNQTKIMKSTPLMQDGALPQGTN